MADYTLELNEPWTFLDTRKNPVSGRLLTFAYKDGTIFLVTATLAEALDPEIIRAKLEEQIKAHEAMKAL